MAQEHREPHDENTRIEPLSDEALEEAAGGEEISRDQICSLHLCSSPD